MPSVLLVDDSQVARAAVATRLLAEGFDVHQVASAAEARSVDLSTIACAIIDVELEDGDGPTLADELQATHPSLPVAFFTAGAGASLVRLSSGPVFAKPALDPLIAWVRQVS